MDSDSPARLVAYVDLESEGVWLFRQEEFTTLVRQQSRGRYNLYCYSGLRTSRCGPCSADLESYRFENRFQELFGPVGAGADSY